MLAGGNALEAAADAGAPLDLRALRSVADSADAALLLPVTPVVAGAAWAASGDAVRALAVLVVATPCPPILAAPIALTSGLSRSAAEPVRGGVPERGRSRP
jgi:cation transport ATPase